jgi:hypothetical protein
MTGRGSDASLGEAREAGAGIEHEAPGCVLDDGQALSAAQSTALEHIAAAHGGHSLEEAVLALPRNALRLVRTLGHGE